MPANQKVIEEGESSNFIDDLGKMQRTEFTCPQRRNEFWQTKVSAIIMHQSTLEDCVVKVVKENSEEN